MPAPEDRIQLLPGSVIKRFADARDFEREYAVYRLGLPMVPRLLEYREPEWISLERVTGQAYLDGAFGRDEATALALTLAAFHQATLAPGLCLCHWDNQPRNILRSGSVYHLIDFSESRRDCPEADLTHLLLFWAAEFAPARFRDLLEPFLAAYRNVIPLSGERWIDALAQSRERFELRRARYGRRPRHASGADWLANLALLATALNIA